MTTSTEPLVVLAHATLDGAVLVLAGDLDVETRRSLDDAVDAALDAGAGSIVVDLAGLRFCDAAGVGILVGARVRAAEGGADLAVRRPVGQVRRVLDLTGVGAYLEGGSSSMPAETASTIDSSR